MKPTPPFNERLFWAHRGSGEDIYLEAIFHRGGVKFTEYTTNPNYGGASDLGEMSYEELFAKGPPDAFDAAQREEILRCARARPTPRVDDPDGWDPHGLSWLTRAALKGDAAEVARLLAAGADPHHGGADPKLTPLVAAARNQHLAIVELLLAASAPVDDAELLASAIASGDRAPAALRMIERLLAAGARPDPAALIAAVSARAGATLRALLRAGASVATPTWFGDLPINVAAGYDAELLVEFLLAGAELRHGDARGRTPLHQAIEDKCAGSVRLLLAAGVLVGADRAFLDSIAVLLRTRPAHAELIAAVMRDPIDFALAELERDLRAVANSADDAARALLGRRIAVLSSRLLRDELERSLPEYAARLREGTLGIAEEAGRRISSMRNLRSMAAIPMPQGLERALVTLLHALTSIGEANDALDRGYQEAADRIMGGVERHVRDAWALEPVALAALLPDLAPSLSTGTFATSTWSALAARVQTALEQHRGRGPAGS